MKNGSTQVLIFVPIWSFVLLTAMPTAWLFWRDRRRAPGLCVKCGYDLRGADHKVCPECGSPPPLPSPAEPREGVKSPAP